MTLLLETEVEQTPRRACPLIINHSLSHTLDAVEEAMFEGRAIAPSERERIARWIASRPVGYAGMPSPMPHDYCEGARVFTGETIESKVGIAHVLGEEACRTLLLLNTGSAAAHTALDRAEDQMVARLAAHESSGRPRGLYCCARCSVALWRHLAAGGLHRAGNLVVPAMRALKSARDRRGRWKGFPFHYTVLALTEIGDSLARREIRYAAPILERFLRSGAGRDKYHARRLAVAERALTIL